VMRPLVRLITVLALVAGALLVPTVSSAPVGTAEAADGRLFDAGNIISDAVFFDSRSMDPAAIQAFLDAKGASCRAGAMPCLKDYRQDTAPQPADKYCAGYQGAPQETAAWIIAKAAASCGINPRVLLVLLQKEQTLVTGTENSANRYLKATGMGCPDTATCNPAFSGFVSQVYFAAQRFQKYRIDAASYRFRAGRTYDISYYPAHDWVGVEPNRVYYGNQDDRRCGTAHVAIANQATAGLYNYTPYVPNQAALDAYPAGVPGAPDVICSAYGNRNFWFTFTNWFGSTQSTGAGAILETYNAMGGEGSWLGKATGGYICGLARAGCGQNFQGGSIYWSPASGAHAVRGLIGGTWVGQGYEKGWLGYPVGAELCGLPRGGCAQNFQGGSLYFSPKTGVHPVEAPMHGGYAASGYERGPLGYPVDRQVCGMPRGGCRQGFEAGTVYASPTTGAYVVHGAIQAVWGARGGAAGPLGYPTGAESCGAGARGCVQKFEGGTMAWSPATGEQYVKGSIGAKWLADGGPKSAIGQPIGSEICGLPRGGCGQNFQSGSIYWAPGAGAHVVRGAIGGVWASRGFEAGPLGYPLGGEVCGPTGVGCAQQFETATMHWSPTASPRYVVGAIQHRWLQLGSAKSSVGAPTGPEVCGLIKGGCYQRFSNGAIYFTPATGAHPVEGAIRDAWGGLGWETGQLGYPVEAQQAVPGGFAQRFQGGTLTLTTASGTVARS
jgi:uncharacterized protein with LGFP repeats